MIFIFQFYCRNDDNKYNKQDKKTITEVRMPETKELRKVTPEDLFRLDVLQDALLSPDGKTAVYGLSHVDAEKEEEYANLWLLDIERGESRALTVGKNRDSAAAWSADVKTIAFRSNREEGKPQVYLIPIDCGEARALTSIKQGVGGGPVWSPDGNSIAFTAGPELDEPPDPTKPYRVTRSTYRFDGAGYLDPLVQDIYTIPVDGGEPKQLTNDRFSNSAPRWSPNGEEILYLASMNPDSFSFFPGLKVVNLKGETRTIIGEDWGAVSGAEWTSDGGQIIFVGTPKERKAGTKNEIWLVDKQGGEPESRSANLKYSFCGALRADLPKSWRAIDNPLLLVSKDGSSVYTTVHIGGSIHIYKVALVGPETCTPLIAIADRPSVLMDTDEGQLLFGVSTPKHPCDLFIADMDGENERQLTHLNAGLLAELEMAPVERVQYPNEDGQDIEGWVMTPPGAEGAFPTVLYIHGGPHSAFGNMFSFDYQMLAGAGYAVLYINPRGSSGYGDDFQSCIIQDWGDPVFSDLMIGVDHIIATGIADPDKLGCYGLSYGGYMSCWIVGHTERFKAAVPENPVTNLVSFYGTSDIGHLFTIRQMGGAPHENPTLYQELSPITYAQHCKTPTLMIQGEADWRCPAEQSEQFYTVLKANGCIVEMVRLPGSPHAGTISGAPVIRRYANEALLDWMNRYVKGITKEE
ncbi:MAG: S9 family peptidase [Anaerolineaceae bacterium]|nr:S9 family peptidase [Anaerolineaceae bacterium]